MSKSKVTNLDEYVARVVADAPPLSDAQRESIARILRSAEPKFDVSHPVVVSIKR